MAGSSFELLMQEILNQKQRMDELIEENHHLRHQLAELRAGHGIFLEICGQRYALNTADLPTASFEDNSQDHSYKQTASPFQDVPTVEQAAISMPLTGASTDTPPTVEPSAISMPLTETTMGNIPETPRPDTDQFEPLPASLEQTEVETAELPPSTFLEEMLIDEFAAASTTQMPSWKDAQTRKLPTAELIDDEEKAVLRKQLIGSFLLE